MALPDVIVKLQPIVIRGLSAQEELVCLVGLPWL